MFFLSAVNATSSPTRAQFKTALSLTTKDGKCGLTGSLWLTNKRILFSAAFNLYMNISSSVSTSVTYFLIYHFLIPVHIHSLYLFFMSSATIIHLNSSVFPTSSPLPSSSLGLSVVCYQGPVAQILFLCFCALSCSESSSGCLCWWGNHSLRQKTRCFSMSEYTVVSKKDINTVL